LTTNIWTISFDKNKVFFSNLYTDTSIPLKNINNINVVTYDSRDSRSLFLTESKYLEITINYTDLIFKRKELQSFKHSYNKSFFFVNINNYQNDIYNNIITKINKFSNNIK
jgi:hypothetical protein